MDPRQVGRLQAPQGVGDHVRKHSVRERAHLVWWGVKRDSSGRVVPSLVEKCLKGKNNDGRRRGGPPRVRVCVCVCAQYPLHGVLVVGQVVEAEGDPGGSQRGSWDPQQLLDTALGHKLPRKPLVQE